MRIPVGFENWPDQSRLAIRPGGDGREADPCSRLTTEMAKEFPDAHAMALRLGHPTILRCRWCRTSVAIGARRSSERRYGRSGKADRLLQTFADQAVIAIENVRLFEEVQARTAS